MLISVSRMPHLGGAEYVNPEAIIRIEPLEYVEKGQLYDGSRIHLEGGTVVESSDEAETIAQAAGLLQEETDSTVTPE